MDNQRTYKVVVRIGQQIFEAQMGDDAIEDINLNGINSNINKALKQCSTYTVTMKRYKEPVAIMSKIITGVDTESQPMELESEVSNI